MQTAAFVLESRCDPIGYHLGDVEKAWVQLRSKPASIVMATASTPYGTITTRWLFHATPVTTSIPAGKVGIDTATAGMASYLYFSYFDADGIDQRSRLMSLPDNYNYYFVYDNGTYSFEYTTSDLPVDTGTLIRVPVYTFAGMPPTEGLSQRLRVPGRAGDAGGVASVTVSVNNAGSMVYTPSPIIPWGDPARGYTRNVQRGKGGGFVPIGGGGLVVAATLLIRAEKRYIKFGGWSDVWSDGVMALYDSSFEWGYWPKVNFDGLDPINVGSVATMDTRLNRPGFTTVEGQVIIGSGRGGGPGSLQLKTGNQELSFWHNPCKIVMTSPNGARWNITPGAGGALTPVAA